jgi:nucleoside-diphosphate-sugar epimerase
LILYRQKPGPIDLNLFCFGYGYVAQHLSAHIQSRDYTIYGTQRLSTDQERIFAYDGNDVLSDKARAALADCQAILISIPPDRTGCPVAQVIDRFLPELKSLQWVGYLSTTGVYGDTRGNWVDETAPLQPTSERATQRVLAEQQWLQWGQNNNVPVQIFRLSGIYGPGRSPFERIAFGEGTIIDAPFHVFNRIHVDDIAQILSASLQNPLSGAIYNVSDDLPARQEDMMRLAYELLGKEAPEPVPLTEANLSPMAREFYFDCKRVCNEKIKNELGVSLRYPTYVEGLTAIYKDKETKPSA